MSKTIKWCEEGRHWGISLRPLCSDRPLTVICTFCGKTLYSELPAKGDEK